MRTYIKIIAVIFFLIGTKCACAEQNFFMQASEKSLGTLSSDKHETELAEVYDDHPKWSMNNVTCRSDFRNCKIQFEENKTGHVAFLGGSITEMNGYRPMMCSFLKEKFPSTEFTFTNAGIASTGSTTCAFRMERDVLAKGLLDLLFVEFAVNDDKDIEHAYEQAIMGMEAIIRKALKHNPNVDIVMTFFVNPNILNDYQQGKVRASVAAHKAVAKYYNISTCNLAKEVAEQISIGTLDWETYGGTHPNDFGNRICANMISSMLEKVWNRNEGEENLEPMNIFNFENGRLVNPANCDYDKKWVYAIPSWENLKGKKRERFLNRRMLCTTKHGASLTFEFEGTAVGAYVLAGPDAGLSYVSLDKQYIDGTKIEAASNKYTFVWRRSTEKHKVKPEDQIKRY